VDEGGASKGVGVRMDRGLLYAGEVKNTIDLCKIGPWNSPVPIVVI
jgi:hypothetical protein